MLNSSLQKAQVKMETEAYFAKINNKKISLFNKKIALPISVGQAYHEHERFCSTIDLLNDYEVAHCDIIVADTLQRHTHQINSPSYSPEYLYRKALDLGDLWIQRNINSIRELRCKFRVLRWDQWLFCTNYAQRRGEIEALIDSDEGFRHTFYETALKFVERYIRNSTKTLDKNLVLASCMNYVLEECAVMSLWAPEGHHFEVYPGKRIKAMVITYEYFVKPFYSDTLNWLRIHFKDPQLVPANMGMYEKNRY